MAESKEPELEGKKILIIVGDYVEDYEAMVPFQTLSAAGYVVHCVCPGKSADDSVKTCVHDFEGDQTYSEKRGHDFAMTYDFKEAVKNKKQYSGLVIPGGRSVEYLSVKQEVVELTAHFTSNDLPIAAVCHGPMLLPGGYLKGKKATAYPACRPYLDLAGAEWQEPDPMEKCFTDGQLVTGPAWPCHPDFCGQLMKVMGAKISSQWDKGRVLIIAGDFVEDYELMVVFQALLTFGLAVDVVCPGKKKDDAVKTAVHDFEGDQTYTEKRGHNFVLNADFDGVKVADYDGLYIPGGRSPEYLSTNDKVLGIVQEFAKSQKVICQVCHGVLLLAAAKILGGRKTTCYPACAPVVQLCDAEYLAPEPITKAFTDKKEGAYTLVSGGAWPAHIEMVRQFVNELGVTITV